MPVDHRKPHARAQPGKSVLDGLSYCQATATPCDPFPTLEEAIEADVADIGAGFIA